MRRDATQTDITASYGSFHRSSPAGTRWLDATRERAVDAFTRAGIPSRDVEDYKYTDLREFAARSATYLANGSAAVDDATVQAALAAIDFAPGEIVAPFANGLFAEAHSNLSKAPDGVRIVAFQSDAAAVNNRLAEELGRLAPVDRYPLVALNTAFLADGLYVEVDSGAHLASPLHVVFLTDAQPVSTQPRLIVRLGRASSATVIEHHIGAGASLSNAVTELFCDEGSALTFLKIQSCADDAFHLAAQHARLDRDSRLSAVHIDAGAGLARNDLHVKLAGSGAYAELAGLYLAGADQHTDHHTNVEHEVRDTTSAEAYRGLVAGAGTAVFNGRIIVHRGADGTDAQLDNRNLLLSTHAEINTKPELEIYADDVKCSHGATTGRLDEDALHYLRTRGIDANTARRMLINAFTAEVLRRIALPHVHRHVEALVTDRLEKMI